MATCKKAKVQEKQTHVMLTEPCVIETFTNVRTFETRNLRLDEPGCWNSEVRFRKTRVTIEIVEETCTAVQGDHDRLASKRHGTQRLSCLLLEGVVAGYPQHKVSAGDLCHREGDVLGTISGSNTGCVDYLNVLKI